MTDRGPHHLSSRRLGDKRCPNFSSRERGAGGLKSCPLTKKSEFDITHLICSFIGRSKKIIQKREI